jgi:hypothetical protein
MTKEGKDHFFLIENEVEQQTSTQTSLGDSQQYERVRLTQ